MVVWAIVFPMGIICQDLDWLYCSCPYPSQKSAKRFQAELIEKSLDE
jgi:hypothetical protein